MAARNRSDDNDRRSDGMRALRVSSPRMMGDSSDDHTVTKARAPGVPQPRSTSAQQFGVS
ncbi:hypothetical protein CR51_02855 [Caballeronia megalochromosomata]|nr:hypothetical protein CR51_02855 [Caballeronia megalochromosomata]